MYAVISGLDSQALQYIHELRQVISEKCPSAKEPMALDAHLSWQAAESYRIDLLKEKIATLAKVTAPVKVNANGLGLFTGPEPVLFLMVSRSPQLTEMHRRLWDELIPLADQPNPYFAPDMWIPHVSIFYGDSNTASNLVCGLSELIQRPVSMELTINQIAIAYYKNNKYGVESPYKFRGDGR